MGRRVLDSGRRPVVVAVPTESDRAGIAIARGVLAIRGDGGSRAREAITLQRLAGNRAVGQALAMVVAGDAVGHGTCSTPDLACSARAEREYSKNLTVGAPVKKKDKEGNVVYKATGTVSSTFKTKVAIELAQVPDGLSECASKKVGALIKTKLKPHEEDHKRRFLTTNPMHSYVGPFSKSLSETSDDPATAQSTVHDKLDTALEEEAARRRDRNDEYAIYAIDPFHVTADISDCPECASDE